MLVLFDDLQGEAPFAQAAIDPRPAPERACTSRWRTRAASSWRAPSSAATGWASRPGGELALLHALTRGGARAGRSRGPAGRGRGGAARARRARSPRWTPERVESRDRRAGGGGARRREAAARGAAARRCCSAARCSEHPQAAGAAAGDREPRLGERRADRDALVRDVRWARSTTRRARSTWALAPDCLPGYVPRRRRRGARRVREVVGRARCPAGRAVGARGARRGGRGQGARAVDRLRRLARERARSRAGRARAAKRCELVIVNELFLTETARARARGVPGRRVRREGRRGDQLRAARCSARRARCRRVAARAPTGRSSSAVARALGADVALPHQRGRLPRDRAPRARLRRARAGATLIPDGATWQRRAAASRGSLRRPRRRAARAAGDGLSAARGRHAVRAGQPVARAAHAARSCAGAARAFLQPDEARAPGARGGRPRRARGTGRLARRCRSSWTTPCRRARCSCPTRTPRRGLEPAGCARRARDCA